MSVTIASRAKKQHKYASDCMRIKRETARKAIASGTSQRSQQKPVDLPFYRGSALKIRFLSNAAESTYVVAPHNHHTALNGLTAKMHVRCESYVRIAIDFARYHKQPDRNTFDMMTVILT